MASPRVVSGCHCLCARWGDDHLGECEGEATTTRSFHSPQTGTREVPLCEPCAAVIDERAPRTRVFVDGVEL